MSRFPPPSTKRYQVVSYDVSDEPAGDAVMRLRGEFDDPAEALACAQAVIDRDLEGYKNETTAEAMEGQFTSFGEGSMIWGEPPVPFHCYLYAAERCRAIIARRALSVTK